MRNRNGFFAGLIFAISAIIFSACGNSTPNQGSTTINIQPARMTTVQNNLAEGLDLKAVGELVKQARDGEDLERRLNTPGGVNNLDLNEDGQTDYIHVTEYGSGNSKGFSLTVDLGNGRVQEVATIAVERDSSNGANVQLAGNSQLYGPNYYYHDHFTFGDYLLLSWMFSPRPYMYASPYRYGYYPSYYSPYRTVPVTQYRTVTRTVTERSTIKQAPSSQLKSNVASPNANKNVERSSLRNPTKSQRSFTERDSSKPVGSGGFGRTPSAPTPPAPKETPKAAPAPARTAPPPVSRPSAPSKSSGFSGGRRK